MRHGRAGGTRGAHLLRVAPTRDRDTERSCLRRSPAATIHATRPACR